LQRKSMRCKAALRKGDWKLLIGRLGNGSWIPAPEVNTTDRSPPNSDTGKNLFLFNITNDPEEREEISRQHPNVVQDLLARIRMYNSTAVPGRFPKPDPLSNPQLHGGVWKPWLD